MTATPRAIWPVIGRLLAATLWLPVAAAAAGGQSSPDVTILGNYILANQASSPYGDGRRVAPHWCYDTPSDAVRDFWDYVEPRTGQHTIAAVWNAFKVPFFFNGYIPVGARAPIAASIIVGFEVTGYLGPLPPTADRAAPVAASDDPCELGQAIYMRAPFPIIGIPGKDRIARVSTIDPAPEYRWWSLLGRTERVRLVQRIPVRYSVNGTATRGFVVVGFGQEAR
jgi:hypothetical protein